MGEETKKLKERNRIGKRNRKEKRRKQEKGKRRKKRQKKSEFPNFFGTVATTKHWSSQLVHGTGGGYFISQNRNANTQERILEQKLYRKTVCLTFFFMTCLVCFLIQWKAICLAVTSPRWPGLFNIHHQSIYPPDMPTGHSVGGSYFISGDSCFCKVNKNNQYWTRTKFWKFNSGKAPVWQEGNLCKAWFCWFLSFLRTNLRQDCFWHENTVLGCAGINWRFDDVND